MRSRSLLVLLILGHSSCDTVPTVSTPVPSTPIEVSVLYTGYSLALLTENVQQVLSSEAELEAVWNGLGLPARTCTIAGCSLQPLPTINFEREIVVLATGDNSDCGTVGPMIESASKTAENVRIDVVLTRLSGCICPLVWSGRRIVLARLERPTLPITFRVSVVNVPCG